MPNLSCRALFDIPDDVAYFNTAYNAPLLRASRDALVCAAGAKLRPWERAPADFFADAETLRGVSAALFGTAAENFAIVPAASYGISTAARILEPRLQAGDHILVAAQEFPSNIFPWQRIAAERGAAIRTAGRPVDGDWTRAVLAALDPSVRIAALSACHWTDGATFDLVAIGAACRANGTVLVLDVTQSLGAAPLDLAEAAGSEEGSSDGGEDSGTPDAVEGPEQVGEPGKPEAGKEKVDVVAKPPETGKVEPPVAEGALALTAANFDTAYAAMAAYKNADNKVMGIVPDTLIVPPQLRTTAHLIAHAAFVPSTAGTATQSNPNEGVVDVLVLPELASEATTWYLACLKSPFKPLIYQNRKAPVLEMLFGPDSEHAKKTKKIVFGADCRAAFGYTLPQLMIRSTG